MIHEISINSISTLSSILICENDNILITASNAINIICKHCDKTIASASASTLLINNNVLANIMSGDELKILVIYKSSKTISSYTKTLSVFKHQNIASPIYGSQHLIDAQIIDSDNNLIFCVYETDSADIINATLAQDANRNISYETYKNFDVSIPVFGYNNKLTNDILYAVCSNSIENHLEYQIKPKYVFFIPISAKDYFDTGVKYKDNV